jgi:hypothetical protein
MQNNSAHNNIHKYFCNKYIHIKAWHFPYQSGCHPYKPKKAKLKAGMGWGMITRLIWKRSHFISYVIYLLIDLKIDWYYKLFMFLSVDIKIWTPWRSEEQPKDVNNKCHFYMARWGPNCLIFDYIRRSIRYLRSYL